MSHRGNLSRKNLHLGQPYAAEFDSERGMSTFTATDATDSTITDKITAVKTVPPSFVLKLFRCKGWSFRGHKAFAPKQLHTPKATSAEATPDIINQEAEMHLHTAPRKPSKAPATNVPSDDVKITSGQVKFSYYNRPGKNRGQIGLRLSQTLYAALNCPEFVRYDLCEDELSLIPTEDQTRIKVIKLSASSDFGYDLKFTDNLYGEKVSSQVIDAEVRQGVHQKPYLYLIIPNPITTAELKVDVSTIAKAEEAEDAVTVFDPPVAPAAKAEEATISQPTAEPATHTMSDADRLSAAIRVVEELAASMGARLECQDGKRIVAEVISTTRIGATGIDTKIG